MREYWGYVLFMFFNDWNYIRIKVLFYIIMLLFNKSLVVYFFLDIV